ncbi:MAG: dTDP-4-dehydrorhamnose 3,5-epimerase [Calditrichaeota bacterium]|nr:dTDP-4-dehydrorhamnose 3,5-epimerase [Calditrichota bacterium]RQW01589.1 MAG: dTDP-4-dehydrorhamnose 3,5-epimerase [Calditrichota bacterium]
MYVTASEIPEILIIEPTIFEDRRGFFFESYNEREYRKHGIHVTFVQDNHSRSIKNTIRGLHYQKNPGQEKLVRTVVGEVFDVAVDIRFNSPTFGKWVGIYLSAENKKQVFIPRGFAHGFCVVSDIAEFEYKCSDYYSPADERGILWNDPDLAINWPVNDPIISKKDRINQPFKSIERDFIF